MVIYVTIARVRECAMRGCETASGHFCIPRPLIYRTRAPANQRTRARI